MKIVTPTSLILLCLIVPPSFAGDIFTSKIQLCPENSIHVTPSEASAKEKEICRFMNTFDSARLANLAVLRGMAHGCVINTFIRDNNQDYSLCKSVQRVEGTTCPTGTQLVTADEAKDNTRGDKDNLCLMLKENETVALANGKSMTGIGMGCKVQDQDPQTLTASLCKDNIQVPY
ncbi:MAG: hypothetical protein LPD71_05685 [Shewanella sp.]|nr:hypothetical protein [Shewanella sp.]MCF1429473.1 hypothetical protein [Shewanella sp.]MCF1438242.1 hypothetical protein [Shewanella sp.]MCF1456664.1 hypothetical protein [Shewanella sp.]